MRINNFILHILQENAHFLRKEKKIIVYKCTRVVIYSQMNTKSPVKHLSLIDHLLDCGYIVHKSQANGRYLYVGFGKKYLIEWFDSGSDEMAHEMFIYSQELDGDGIFYRIKIASIRMAIKWLEKK